MEKTSLPLNLPLMHNNITNDDVSALIEFLDKNRENIILTQSNQVNKFEKKWSEWVGAKKLYICFSYFG